MEDLVRIKYWTPTENNGEWMLSGLIDRDTAQQIVDSGAYRNAHIVEDEV